MTGDEGLIAWAANSMSEPLELAGDGVVLIKADVAQAILNRANEIGLGASVPEMKRAVAEAVEFALCEENMEEIYQASQAAGVDLTEFIASAMEAAVTKALAPYRIRDEQMAH